VNGGIRFEMQDTSADADAARPLALTWSGARRMLLALGIAGLVVAAVWSLAGLDGLLTRFPVAAARRDNRALREQQEVLREHAFDLAARLAASVDRGRRLARFAGSPALVWDEQHPRPPVRGDGDEAVLAWLSEEGTRLEAIGIELTAVRTETIVQQASARAPLIVGWVVVRVEPERPVAEAVSPGRPGALPDGR
jgi:hypothetical protein